MFRVELHGQDKELSDPDAVIREEPKDSEMTENTELTNTEPVRAILQVPAIGSKETMRVMTRHSMEW
jgi:hypothetical protein